MRALRFLTLLGMALILGLAFAHVAELPGKLRLTGPDWLTVQHNLYIGFGAFAAVAEPLTILLAWILVFRLRSRPGFAARARRRTVRFRRARRLGAGGLARECYR